MTEQSLYDRQPPTITHRLSTTGALVPLCLVCRIPPYRNDGAPAITESYVTCSQHFHVTCPCGWIETYNTRDDAEAALNAHCGLR